MSAGWARWQLSLALMISLIVGYYDRNNITFALADISRHLGWKDVEAAGHSGALVSAFYVAYGVSNMVLTPLALRYFGARKSLLGMVVLFSVIAALMPFVGRTFGLFILMRCLLGLIEGIHYPTMSAVAHRFFPPEERARGNSVYAAGAILSSVTAPLFLIPLKQQIGWQQMFFVTSLLGAALSLPILYRYLYDSPAQHPRISAAERRYIEQRLAHDKSRMEGGRTSLSQLFSVAGFPVFLCIGVTVSITNFGFLAWLPTYLEKARGFRTELLAPMLAIGSLCTVVGMAFFAWLSDRSKRRLLIICAAIVGEAAAICMTAVSPTIGLTCVSLCVAMFLFGAHVANEWAIVQSILPTHMVAFGGGIYNGGVTLLGGGLGPLLLGEIIAHTGKYSLGIVILSMFLIVTSLLYLWLRRTIRW